MEEKYKVEGLVIETERLILRQWKISFDAIKVWV